MNPDTRSAAIRTDLNAFANPGGLVTDSTHEAALRVLWEEAERQIERLRGKLDVICDADHHERHRLLDEMTNWRAAITTYRRRIQDMGRFAGSTAVVRNEDPRHVDAQLGEAMQVAGHKSRGKVHANPD